MATNYSEPPNRANCNLVFGDCLWSLALCIRSFICCFPRMISHILIAFSWCLRSVDRRLLHIHYHLYSYQQLEIALTNMPILLVFCDVSQTPTFIFFEFCWSNHSLRSCLFVVARTVVIILTNCYPIVVDLSQLILAFVSSWMWKAIFHFRWFLFPVSFFVSSDTHLSSSHIHIFWYPGSDSERMRFSQCLIMVCEKEADEHKAAQAAELTSFLVHSSRSLSLVLIWPFCGQSEQVRADLLYLRNMAQQHLTADCLASMDDWNSHTLQTIWYHIVVFLDCIWYSVKMVVFSLSWIDSIFFHIPAFLFWFAFLSLIICSHSSLLFGK